MLRWMWMCSDIYFNHFFYLYRNKLTKAKEKTIKLRVMDYIFYGFCFVKHLHYIKSNKLSQKFDYFMGFCYFYEIFNNISHEILAKQTKPQNFSNENFSTFLSIFIVNRMWIGLDHIKYTHNMSIILHT